jgi:hypothetical protein
VQTITNVSGGVAQVGECVRNPARRQRQLARLGAEHPVARLKGQFTLDPVEGLVGIVVVQSRPGNPAGAALAITDTTPPVSSLRSSTLGPEDGAAMVTSSRFASVAETRSRDVRAPSPFGRR